MAYKYKHIGWFEYPVHKPLETSSKIT